MLLFVLFNWFVYFSMITDDVDILLEQSKKENAAYKNMAQVYKSHSMVWEGC